MAITHRGLRHLRDQGLGVAQQQDLHLTVAVELVLELLPDQLVSISSALHDRPAGGGFAAHEQRDADQAFVADQISADAPSARTYSRETIESVGKKTCRRTSPDSYKTLPSGIWTSRKCG